MQTRSMRAKAVVFVAAPAAKLAVKILDNGLETLLKKQQTTCSIFFAGLGPRPRPAKKDGKSK